jgi:cysteine-rich repeat protein
LVVVATGCVQSNSITCDDGTVCPNGDTCDVTHHLCVHDDQLTACAGKQPGDECHASAVDGHCLDGVCLASVCGDGLVEFGEVCDDGNTVDGTDGVSDGCSADCHSDFSCGNNIVDAFTHEECDDGNDFDHDGCSSTCKIESPHWLSHLVELPSRTETASAYDSKRDRLVVFGGLETVGAPQIVNTTFEWDGIDWTESDTPIAPAPRANATMAYDRDHEVSVLFGGAVSGGGAPFSDTWLWNGVRWQQVYSPTGPSARVTPAMAFDPVRHRVVLFGGNDPIAKMDLADTWEWDGTSWTLAVDPAMTTQHPSARPNAAAFFDPKTGRIVLTGGGQDATPIKDTWAYDGTWHDISPTGTAPQVTRAGIVYDPPNQRAVLIGGYTGSNATTAAMWSWSGSAWTSLGSTSFTKRGASAVARVGGKLVVVGGDDGASTTFAETWLLTGATWARPASPGARERFLAFNDYARARSTIVGGTNPMGTPLADTWDLSATGYVQRAVAGPSARSAAQGGWDPLRNQALLFGGTNANVLGDTWTLDTVGWTQHTVAGPSARRGGTIAFDGTQMILFGGEDSTNVYLNDTWSWNGTTWLHLTPATSPSPRFASSSAYDPVHQELVLFGGYDPNVAFDETWIFDGTTWRNASSNYRPPRLALATLTFNPVRGKLTLIGGSTVTNAYEWDGTTWSVVAAPNSPPGRGSHGAMITPSGAGLLAYSGAVAVDPTDPTSANYSDSRIELRWDAANGANEHCDGTDLDHDGAVGCADPDCWYVCAPLCPPNTTCDPTAPKCGDGICDGPRESCRTCSADCGACGPICGDGFCDPGETCPGDCP